MMSSKLYRRKPVLPLTANQIRQMSDEMRLEIDEDEIPDYQDIMRTMLGVFHDVDTLVEPMLPTKYPRIPGYRPSKEENPHQAWYYKTHIHGADEGPLSGKLLAVKDNIAVAGVPMMNGSSLLEGYVPEFDATVVTKILDAGGDIVGKSTCEDMCFSLMSCFSSKGPLVNPYDNTRNVGGSSSGSAILVHAREVDMALGADQGGSIRVPASWTGIVGLKPTWGLVSYNGACPMESALDHIGPMARTVTECAQFLEVIAGKDDIIDPRQPIDLQVPEYTTLLSTNLQGMKIGLLMEGFEGAEEDVAHIVKDATKQLEQFGASVHEVSVPMHKEGAAVWAGFEIQGAYTTILKNAGATLGMKIYNPTSLVDHAWKSLQTMPGSLSPVMKIVTMLGAKVEKTNGFHWYSKTQNMLRMVQKGYDDVLSQYEVLVMPTVKFLPPPLPLEDASIKDCFGRYLDIGSNTCVFNGTGHPAISVNAGFTQGLPVGLMAVGKTFDDATVLKVAYCVEQIQNK